MEDVPEGGDVAVGPHARDHRVHRRRDDRHSTPLFPHMYVRQMNLHLWYIQGFQSIMQSVRVVGPGSRVYNEPVGVRRLSNKADHLALGVRLPVLEVQSREFVLDKPLYVVEGHGSVDFGSACSEGAQVHTVEYEGLTQQ